MMISRPIAHLLLVAGALYLPLGAGRSDGPRSDSQGAPLPPGAVAHLGTARLRHFNANGLTFSGDGKRLLTCSDWDGAIRVWDVATGKLMEHKLFPFEPGKKERFGRVRLSPGGATAQVYLDEKLYQYDVATGKGLRRLGDYGDLSPDGKFILAHRSLFDVEKGKVRHKLTSENLGSIIWDSVFSPDGKHVAVVAQDNDSQYYTDGRVILWDTTTGAEVNKGKRDVIEGETLAFSPDGRTLAVGRCRGDVVLLLDGSTLRQTGSLPVGRRIIKGLAFSPDGRYLVGAGGETDVVGGMGERKDGKGVFIWDLKGDQQPRQLSSARVHARFAFSPDGKMFVCASRWGGEVFLWDTASGRPLLRQHGHGREVAALAVSSDGKLAASIAADGLYLWKTDTGEALHRLSSRDDRRPVCAFAPDGKRLVTAGPGGSIQVWDVASGGELRRLRIDEASRGTVTAEAAEVSADGKRLSAIFSLGRTVRDQPADSDGRLVVWELAGGKEVSRRPYRLERHPLRGASGGRPLPHGLTEALLAATLCTAYDPPPPEAYGTVHGAFAPGGEVVSAWRGKQVGLEEVGSGRRLALLPAGVGQRLTFSPDGRLVAAARLRPMYKDSPDGEKVPGGITLIEAATGGEVVRLDISTGFFGDHWSVAFTPDSRSLVVADTKGLHVWDAVTGGRLHRMEWPGALRSAQNNVWAYSLAVLPGGRAVTGMHDGQILVWDLAPASWARGKLVEDPGPESLGRAWADLASDARTGQRAVLTLASAPGQAIPFLGGRLRPATEVDQKRVEKLLADLEDRKFAAREAAARELAGLRDRVEPVLQKASRFHPSLETRRRLQSLLAEPFVPPAESLRTLRAVAALERMGTPEGRRLLEKLGGGAAAAETSAATAALDRLKGR